MKRLAFAALLALAGCMPPTSPIKTPSKVSADVIECRSGYHVATRTDGMQFCEEDQ